MTSSTRISFVRHGEVHNPEQIYYGRLPGFALSDRGHREAQAAAHMLRQQPIAAIYSSPLIRARQTAQAIRTFHADAAPGISRNLSEVYSPYDGQPRSVLDALHWDVYAGTAPPYEQPGDLLARTLHFVAAVRREHAGQHVVAATHGDVIVFLLLWAAGWPVEMRNKRQIVQLGVSDGYPAHASITTLVYRTADAGEHPAFEYIEPERVR
jgi:probable phosphoglycerate mutase